MGHTRTFCPICRKIPEFRSFGKILEKRTTLYGITKTYLQEDGCVEGTPTKIVGINPYSDMLGQYYLALLKSELSSHGGDEIESLASMKGMSLIFSEMWAEASEALEGNKHIDNFDLALIALGEPRQRRLDISRLDTVISKMNSQRSISDEDQFTYDYGDLLVNSYSKALVELQLCAKGDDISIIKHHCSLLGDLLDEMLDLVQYLKVDNPPTEEALPLNHPHHISTLDQENSAQFENMTEDKRINLTLEWDSGAITFTEIFPGDVAEITFDRHTAIICHRSDGGSYTTCPIKNVTAKAGDYFQLIEDGGYES